VDDDHGIVELLLPAGQKMHILLEVGR
jgi:hypothetical protein